MAMEFFEFTNLAETFFFNDPLKNYLWAYLLIGAFGFAILYIFQAYALYTIAGNGGVGNRWMAFVPVLNTYYIGVLAAKNKIFNSVKPKYLSAAMAAAEGVCIVLYILHFVAKFNIFGGHFAEPVYKSMVFMNGTMDVLDHYDKVPDFPAYLEWAWWMTMSMPGLVISWFELLYSLAGIFVFIAFFRTYASPRYFIFVIFSVLFPIKGVLMFAVRNNRAKNYGDYLRERQYRQYRAYHDYMNGGQGGNWYGGGQYGQGGPYGNGNSYGQGAQNVPPADPFGGLGGQNGGSSSDGAEGGGQGGVDDPFGDM